jgi:hypothetical protein
MRASTVVAILSLLAWVALSVALPLPAIKYAPPSYCICDAQVLSFFADLSVPVTARYSPRPGRRTRAIPRRTTRAAPRRGLSPAFAPPAPLRPRPLLFILLPLHPPHPRLRTCPRPCLLDNISGLRVSAER